MTIKRIPLALYSAVRYSLAIWCVLSLFLYTFIWV